MDEPAHRRLMQDLEAGRGGFEDRCRARPRFGSIPQQFRDLAAPVWVPASPTTAIPERLTRVLASRCPRSRDGGLGHRCAQQDEVLSERSRAQNLNKMRFWASAAELKTCVQQDEVLSERSRAQNLNKMTS